MVDNVIDPNIIPPTPQNAGGEKKFNKKIVFILFALIILVFIGYFFIVNDPVDRLTTNEPMDYPHRKVLVFGDYPKDINDKKPFKLTLTGLDPNKGVIKTLIFDKPLKMLTNFYYDKALFGNEDGTEYWLIDIHGNKQIVLLSLPKKEITSDIFFLDKDTIIYSQCNQTCQLTKSNLKTGQNSSVTEMPDVKYRLAGISKSHTSAYILGTKNTGEKVFIKYDLKGDKIIKEKVLKGITNDSLWLSPDVQNIAFITKKKDKVIINLSNLSNKQTRQFVYDIDPLPYDVIPNQKLLWSLNSNKITFIAEALRPNIKDCCQKLKLTSLIINNNKFIDIQDLDISVEKNTSDVTSRHNWMDGLAWINDDRIQVSQYTTLDIAKKYLGNPERNVRFDFSTSAKGDFTFSFGKIMSEW